MGAYRKDFAGWTERKLQLQRELKTKFFSEREIWWAAIGHNLGDEEDGKGLDYTRPVLVLRKFNQTCLGNTPNNHSAP